MAHPSPAAAGLAARRPAPEARWPYRISVVLHGVAVEILTDREATRAALAAQFAGFGEAGTPASLQCAIEVLDGDRYRLTDSIGNAAEGSWSRALHFLRARLTAHWMAAGPNHHLWLHASGVCDGTRATLIAGPPGSGKSSLAAACVERGLHYLGDDTLPVDCGAGTVWPVPFPPALRAGYPWWMTTNDFLVQEKTFRLPVLARVRYEPARVTRLVLPSYDASATHPQIDRPSIVDTVAALLPQCLNRDRFDRSVLIDQLINWISNTPSILRVRYAEVEMLAAALAPADGEHGNPASTRTFTTG